MVLKYLNDDNMKTKELFLHETHRKPSNPFSTTALTLIALSQDSLSIQLKIKRKKYTSLPSFLVYPFHTAMWCNPCELILSNVNVITLSSSKYTSQGNITCYEMGNLHTEPVKGLCHEIFKIVVSLAYFTVFVWSWNLDIINWN